VTDEELAAALTEAAKLDRNTAAGLMGVLALAERLDKERPEFAVARQVLAARGSHAFCGEFAVQGMLAMLKKGSTATEAVAWLKKAHATTRAVGGAVKALYGVTCGEPILLADDVVLMRFMDLPQSEMRDWILEDHARLNEARLLFGFTSPPGAALYRAGTVEPLFIPAGTSFDYSKSELSLWFDELDTATLLLALTPKAAPVEAAHWFHYDDPDIARFGQRGVRRHYDDSQTQSPPSKMAGAPTTITPEYAAGVLSGYRRLHKGDGHRVTLALQRLIRSRSQLHPGNRAIDLAIALEVLFMNADRDEHSYKIALRLAKLLCDTEPDRRAAFLETRKLYELRSKMVHTGRARNDWTVGDQTRSAYELVEAGDLRCAHAIRKLIDRGNIPEPDGWSGLELS
jgi:hypothetical protein